MIVRIVLHSLQLRIYRIPLPLVIISCLLLASCGRKNEASLESQAVREHAIVTPVDKQIEPSIVYSISNMGQYLNQTDSFNPFFHLARTALHTGQYKQASKILKLASHTKKQPREYYLNELMALLVNSNYSHKAIELFYRAPEIFNQSIRQRVFQTIDPKLIDNVKFVVDYSEDRSERWFYLVHLLSENIDPNEHSWIQHTITELENAYFLNELKPADRVIAALIFSKLEKEHRILPLLQLSLYRRERLQNTVLFLEQYQSLSNNPNRAVNPNENKFLKPILYLAMKDALFSAEHEDPLQFNEFIPILAKHYLLAGFGKEASMVLEMAPIEILGDAIIEVLLAANKIGDLENYYHWIHKIPQQKLETSKIFKLHLLNYRFLGMKGHSLDQKLVLDEIKNMLNHQKDEGLSASLTFSLIVFLKDSQPSQNLDVILDIFSQVRADHFYLIIDSLTEVEILSSSHEQQEEIIKIMNSHLEDLLSRNQLNLEKYYVNICILATYLYKSSLPEDEKTHWLNVIVNQTESIPFAVGKGKNALSQFVNEFQVN